MKILFVAPNESGSGEAITALHMAEQLTRSGHTVRFLASEFTSRFLRASMNGRVGTLTTDPAENRAHWNRLLGRFNPQAIVFADYPLLFLSSVGRAFVEGPNAVDLDSVDAELLTLDHLGMAQGPVTLSFGPPHLELATESLPPIPARMRVLLPSPLHSPGFVSGRRGVSFRCWDVPLGVATGTRQEVRQRFQRSSDELLVFHSVPTWAQGFCQRHGLPYYRFFSHVLEIYLAGQDRPVTLLSVNGGSLLSQSSADDLRIVNMGQLAPGDYEQIMFASDLMLTDNRVSVSLGKAACATLPCAALRNSYRLIEILDRVENPLRSLLLGMEGERQGAVFPFEVFPIWTRADLQALRLFEDNPMREAMVTLEIYGGEATRQALWEALTDSETRESLQARQRVLIESIARLPSPEEAMLSSVT